MEAVRRKLVTEVVIERIVEHIRENRMGPGDRLPNEQDFLRILGVSRPTLREALRSLSVTGLIDLNPGAGIFVGKPQMLSLLAHGPVPSLLTSPEDVQEFIEARRALEPEIVALAAQKASAKDLANLVAILDRMEQTVANKVYDDKPWVDFHVALFEAAHNRLLTEMTTPIITMLARLSPYMITARAQGSGEEELRQKIAVHRKLFESVRTRNPEIARQAAVKHVEEALAVSMEAMRLMRDQTAGAERPTTKPDS